jgi:hypothetical protein
LRRYGCRICCCRGRPGLLDCWRHCAVGLMIRTV